MNGGYTADAVFSYELKTKKGNKKGAGDNRKIIITLNKDCSETKTPPKPPSKKCDLETHYKEGDECKLIDKDYCVKTKKEAFDSKEGKCVPCTGEENLDEETGSCEPYVK